MIPFEAHNYYHIYNRANGHENLFREERNYYFFMQKYKQHIHPRISTLAYCLMPNHFHFLIFTNHHEQIEGLSKSFSNLFSAYTQACNKTYQRTGSLFQKNCKRKCIDSELYLKKLINYIHFNPVHHGYTHSPELWKYSSYNAILKQHNTSVNYAQVIELFDDISNFSYMHQSPMDFSFDY